MYKACSESCLQDSVVPYSFRALERRPKEASAAVSAALYVHGVGAHC